MEIIDYTIDYNSANDVIDIIGLGDIHLGNVGCDKKHLQEIIDYIKGKKNCYWLGMGDMVETINVNDKRFDPKSIDPSYRIADLDDLSTKQFADICKMLRPIKDKCIGLLTGNHEETSRLHYYRDVTLDLCRELNTQYLSYDAFIRLKFKRNSRPSGGLIYTIYATHGFGGSRRNGPKVSRLEDLAAAFDADIIMVGHEHKKIIAPPITKLRCPHEGALRLESRKQLAIMTGSFLKGYIPGAITYVEKKGYAPADLGVVKIMIKPEKKDMHASL